jgi:hypothetical protein
VNTQIHLARVRLLCTAILGLSILALTACAGTITSIGVPASSPWNQFQTSFMSPHDDLTVVTTGSNITAGLQPNGVLALCNSDQGQFLRPCNISAPVCQLGDCTISPPDGSTNVTLKSHEFNYVLTMSLNRPAFSAGGVEVDSSSAGTVGAVALTLGSGSGLSVGAGFSAGLIPLHSTDSSTVVNDDLGGLAMQPHWADFGSGVLCSDGTTNCDPGDPTFGVLAECGPFEGGDVLLFRVDAQPGTYSLACGSVPLSVTINPPFASVGDCISSLKAQRCAGLTGQDRASCNHAQISVCHATFNVPGMPPQ